MRSAFFRFGCQDGKLLLDRQVMRIQMAGETIGEHLHLPRVMRRSMALLTSRDSPVLCVALATIDRTVLAWRPCPLAMDGIVTHGTGRCISGRAQGYL